MTVRLGHPLDTGVVRHAPVFRRHLPVALVTWAVGAGLLVCLALTVTTAALSWPDDGDRQARAKLAAVEVRRALDDGIADLTAVAAGIEALADADTPRRLLSRLVSTRYRGAAYRAPTGEVRARAGADVATAVTTPGVLVRAPHLYVAVPVTGPRAGLLVAELTLEPAVRLVDSRGRGIGPPRAVDSRTTGTSAPVPGYAGLTVRPESSRATEEHELLLFGVLIATLTAVVFGWLHARIVGPLSALATAADHLVRGDVRDPVIVRRYDRLGLIARDLERVRRDLLRRN